MRNNVYLYTTFMLLLAGIGSFLLSMVIGSTVDASGMLHEPFFLIPLGYIFIFLGIISSVIYLVKRFHK